MRTFIVYKSALNTLCFFFFSCMCVFNWFLSLFLSSVQKAEILPLLCDDSPTSVNKNYLA